jgi:SAM-dependent methyltransferase
MAMIGAALTMLFTRNRYLDSTAPASAPGLQRLQQSMFGYYAGSPYPEYVTPRRWGPESHAAHYRLCEQIPAGSRVLELGCGDGTNIGLIKANTHGVSYFGCDLSLVRLRDSTERMGAGLTLASADTLPFPAQSIDVTLSIFVIEHMVFPARFLDEQWRVLRPGGRLLLIAPDFSTHGMAAEHIGLSYGSGSQKLRRLRVLDALLTGYDTRIVIRRARARRRARIQAGDYAFPVLTNPRCLSVAGFVPDCDAVYPACPEEIARYLQRQGDAGPATIFYRDEHKFGLMVTKA